MISAADLFTSQTIYQAELLSDLSVISSVKKYAPFSAFTSISSLKIMPFRKLSSCFEDNKCFELSRPIDHAIFALSASLGSALSTIIALNE